MIAYKKGTYMCFTKNADIEEKMNKVLSYMAVAKENIVLTADQEETVFRALLNIPNKSIVCNQEWADAHDVPVQLATGGGTFGIIVITEHYAAIGYGPAAQALVVGAGSENFYYLATTQRVLDDAQSNTSPTSMSSYGYEISRIHPLNNYSSELAAMMNIKPNTRWCFKDGSEICTFRVPEVGDKDLLPFTQAETVIIKDSKLIAVGGVDEVANPYIALPQEPNPSKNKAEAIAVALLRDGGVVKYKMAEKVNEYERLHPGVDLDPSDLFCYLEDFNKSSLAVILRGTAGFTPLDYSAYVSGFRHIRQKGALHANYPIVTVTPRAALPPRFEPLITAKLIPYESLATYDSVASWINAWKASTLVMMQDSLTDLLNDFLVYLEQYSVDMRKMASKYVMQASKTAREQLANTNVEQWIVEWYQPAGLNASNNPLIRSLLKEVSSAEVETKDPNTGVTSRQAVPKLLFTVNNPTFADAISSTAWLKLDQDYPDASSLTDAEAKRILGSALNFIALEQFGIDMTTWGVKTPSDPTVINFVQTSAFGYEEFPYACGRFVPDAAGSVYWSDYGFYTKESPAAGVNLYGPNGKLGVLEEKNGHLEAGGVEMLFQRGNVIDASRDILAAAKASFIEKLDRMVVSITQRAKAINDWGFSAEKQKNFFSYGAMADPIKCRGGFWKWTDANNNAGTAYYDEVDDPGDGYVRNGSPISKSKKWNYRLRYKSANSKPLSVVGLNLKIEGSSINCDCTIKYKFFNKCWEKDFSAASDVAEQIKWLSLGCPDKSDRTGNNPDRLWTEPNDSNYTSQYSAHKRGFSNPEYMTSDQFFDDQQKSWAILGGIGGATAAMVGAAIIGFASVPVVGWIIAGVTVAGLIIAALWPWQWGSVPDSYAKFRIYETDAQRISFRDNPLKGIAPDERPSTACQVTLPDATKIPLVEHTIQTRAGDTAIITFFPLIQQYLEATAEGAWAFSPTVMVAVEAHLYDLATAKMLGATNYAKLNDLVSLINMILSKQNLNLTEEQRSYLRKLKSQFETAANTNTGVIPIVTEEALVSSEELDDFDAFDVACSYIGLN